MATILAVANGNWSASGTWTSGIIPTTGDIVVANNRTVTVDVSPLVSQIRNDAVGGATNGGTFSLLSGVTLSADNFFAGSVTSCVIFSFGGTSTISGTINGQTNVNTINVGTVRNAGAGTLIINGTVIGPPSSSTNSTVVNNNGTLIINGAVSGGLSGSDSRCVYAPAGTNGTIIINGNIANSTGGSAVQIFGGSLIVNSGIITGGTTNSTVSIASPASGIINSDIIGPTPTSTSACVSFSSPSILIVNGEVRGGVASGPALQNSSVGSVIINNTVTGGIAGIGVLNSSTGSVTVNGIAVGGSGNVGVYNQSTGTVICTLAKGNAYGIGSSGLTPQVGLFNLVAGNCYVSGLEFGDRGMSPVIGPVQFINSTGNFCSMYRPSGLSKKILVDPLVSGSLLPSASDVRKNTVYGLGNLVGSLSMPPSETVSYGVLTDNTSGTAILNNPNQIWDYPVSNITGVNSIGNRLKNCSTVENLGQQLANILSSMNS